MSNNQALLTGLGTVSVSYCNNISSGVSTRIASSDQTDDWVMQYFTRSESKSTAIYYVNNLDQFGKISRPDLSCGNRRNETTGHWIMMWQECS